MTSKDVSLSWLLLSFCSVSLEHPQHIPGISKLTEPEIALFINSCKSVFPVVFFILNKRIIIHLGAFSANLSSVTSCFFLSSLPSYVFIRLPHLVNSTPEIFWGFVISSHLPLTVLLPSAHFLSRLGDCISPCLCFHCHSLYWISPMHSTVQLTLDALIFWTIHLLNSYCMASIVINAKDRKKKKKQQMNFCPQSFILSFHSFGYTVFSELKKMYI